MVDYKKIKLVSRETARELDRIAEEKYSIPTILLMENAGKGVAEECLKLAKEENLKKFLVIAGTGNNGGDGFCAAKHIKNAGYDIKIALLQDQEKIKGDSLENFIIAKKMGIPINKISKIQELQKDLEEAEIVIDSIFGTGLSRDIEDEFIISVIKEINSWREANSKRKIVAVDIPSGIDSNTGVQRPVSIKADITVTFAPAKVGLFIGEFDRAGEVRIKDIGIPLDLWRESKIELVYTEKIKEFIKPRNPLAHKGNFGHLLCVCGGVGRAGAAILAGKSALRTGAGLVTMMVPETIYEIVASGAKEYMVFPAPGKGRAFSEKSAEIFEELVEGKTAVLIGPGIWTQQEVKHLLERVIKISHEKNLPIILDADALNILTEILPLPEGLKAVITPHPGEAARILKLSSKEIQKDRIKHAIDLSKTTNSVCVLKGARTIITDGENVFINTSGGVELATGGTGDVLSGIIGGFLAQGYPPIQSAVMGVFIHGIAGELAKKGKYPLSLAEQVCEKIQEAISHVIYKT